MSATVEGTQGLQLKGFMEVELVNQKTGGMQVFQFNTITDIGKLLFLATGPSMQLMHPSQIDRGAVYVESPFSRVSTHQGLTVANVDRGITLNLVNSPVVLTPQSTSMPVFTNGVIDPTKLIGHASYRRLPSSPQEGVIDQTRGEHLVDPTSVVQRWKFSETQANGTFNKLCIGAGVHNSTGNGFAISKGINPAEISTFGGVWSLDSGYMRPGVPGFTANNEILVNVGAGAHPSRSNAVYNLETGVLTVLASSDPRHGVLLGSFWGSQVFHNGNLYFIEAGMMLMRFTVATGAVVGLAHAEALFAEGNRLFYGHASSVLTCLNMDTLAAEPAFDINLGLQPFTTRWFWADHASLVLRNTAVGRDTDGNYLIMPRDYVGGSFGPRWSMVVSDIRNIEASIVGFRPFARSVSEYIVGAKRINISSGVQSDVGAIPIVGLSDHQQGRALTGLKFSENWFGNLISYVQLASPITKTADDVLYISYGYRYV